MFREIQLVYLLLAFLGCFAFAAEETIYLWPGETPANPVVHQKEEYVENRSSDQNELGLNRAYYNVSKPTMTIFPASKENNSGVAVILFPGGGYSHITFDKEGIDIARLLNKNGISSFVVKYSTIPDDFQKLEENEQNKIMQTIVADGQRAIRIVRHRAEEWGVNPDKVGVMGFSAGGNLTYRVATNYDAGLEGDGPIASQNCKVNFTAPIYPWLPDGVEKVDTETPPMFVVVANDDKTAPADQSIALISALRKNGVPSELHIFTNGGHGFGKGVKGGAVTAWPRLFIEWLKEMNILEN